MRQAARPFRRSVLWREPCGFARACKARPTKSRRPVFRGRLETEADDRLHQPGFVGRYAVAEAQSELPCGADIHAHAAKKQVMSTRFGEQMARRCGRREVVARQGEALCEPPFSARGDVEHRFESLVGA